MSTQSIDPAMLATVKEFVELLKSQPSLIFTPDLKFLREYLTAAGANLPRMPEFTTKSGAGDSKNSAKPKQSPNVEEVIDDEMEVEEEFPELPQEGVVSADEVDTSQEMGSDAEPGEEAIEKSNELKMEAVGLFNEGKFQECTEKYTEAIKLNGSSAVLFAKRGQAYLRLEKPNACIKDTTRALELNPDSAVAFKFRGRAHRLLGHWEEAGADLRQACKIDFDEQTDEWLKEVQPHARKVEEWRIRKKLRDEERDIQQRKARAQERARAHAASAEAHHQQEQDEPGMDDFLGGLGGIMGDPEIADLINDPDVAEAFKDIAQNPANLLKYQNNPKVMKFMQAFQKKMGGMGGMPGMGGGMPGGFPGGMPGGMGGFPGMPGGFPGGMPGFGGASAPPPPKPNMKPPGDDLD